MGLDILLHVFIGKTPICLALSLNRSGHNDNLITGVVTARILQFLVGIRAIAAGSSHFLLSQHDGVLIHIDLHFCFLHMLVI